MSVLLLLACASEDFSVTHRSPDLVLDAPRVGPLVNTPPIVIGTPAAAPVLRLDVSGEIDGFVELIPFREAGGDVAWTGIPLALTAIDRTALELVLPDAPPADDRAAASDAGLVTYAIAVRAADGDGAPGAYTGLADAELVHADAATEDGASAGWNLVVRYGEQAAWRSLDGVIPLSENLVGPGSLAVAGSADVAVGPDTRFALATLDDVTIHDDVLTDAWSLSFTLPPPEAALATDRGLQGTILYLQAYDDDGADGVRTDEAIVGQGCLLDAPVAVTWFAYAYDLRRARMLMKRGLRSGWDLVHQADDGLLPVAESDRTSIVLATICE